MRQTYRSISDVLQSPWAAGQPDAAAQLTYFVLTKKEDKKFPLAVAGILALIYLYLYITVNLEELSLLAGSLGLFITIIIVMYATRNVEWYKEENKS